MIPIPIWTWRGFSVERTRTSHESILRRSGGHNRFIAYGSCRQRDVSAKPSTLCCRRLPGPTLRTHWPRRAPSAHSSDGAALSERETAGLLDFVYLFTGAPGRVLDAYERNVEVGVDENGQTVFLWHPSFAPARKTERFKAMMRNAGMVDYWRAKGWPEFLPAGRRRRFRVRVTHGSSLEDALKLEGATGRPSLPSRCVTSVSWRRECAAA